MNKAAILGLALILCCSAAVSYAKPFVYSLYGQLAQQQQAVESECDQWGRGYRLG